MEVAEVRVYNTVIYQSEAPSTIETTLEPHIT